MDVEEEGSVREITGSGPLEMDEEVVDDPLCVIEGVDSVDVLEGGVISDC